MERVRERHSLSGCEDQPLVSRDGLNATLTSDDSGQLNDLLIRMRRLMMERHSYLCLGPAESRGKRFRIIMAPSVPLKRHSFADVLAAIKLAIADHDVRVLGETNEPEVRNLAIPRLVICAESDLGFLIFNPEAKRPLRVIKQSACHADAAFKLNDFAVENVIKLHGRPALHQLIKIDG